MSEVHAQATPRSRPASRHYREMQEALEADGEKLRALTGEDNGPWDWNPFDGPDLLDGNFAERSAMSKPWGAEEHRAYREGREKAATLTAARNLLDADQVAATLVAATISTVQSTRESRPAFVKRIVRSWLDEMERQS